MNVARLARLVYRPLLCIASEGERLALGDKTMIKILACKLSIVLAITAVAAIVPTIWVSMAKCGCSHALSFQQIEHAWAQHVSTLSPTQNKAA